MGGTSHPKKFGVYCIPHYNSGYDRLCKNSSCRTMYGYVVASHFSSISKSLMDSSAKTVWLADTWINVAPMHHRSPVSICVLKPHLWAGCGPGFCGSLDTCCNAEREADRGRDRQMQTHWTVTDRHEILHSRSISNVTVNHSLDGFNELYRHRLNHLTKHVVHLHQSSTATESSSVTTKITLID